MSEELMITQQDLIDWLDRPPSNDDLDLATFISTRLENFYKLQNQLQQKENIIKGLDNTIENLEEVVEHKENIIKEVREKLKTQLAFTSNYQLNYQSAMYIIEEAKQILDKEVD